MIFSADLHLDIFLRSAVPILAVNTFCLRTIFGIYFGDCLWYNGYNHNQGDITMAYLKNFVGQNLLRIEGGRIKEYSSGMTKYIINGNRLTDFAGRTLCTFDGERIKDFGGRTLLTVSTDTVRNFSGQTIARFDTNSIKNFGGQTQYRIDGFLSRSEMMALIAIIYAI